MRLMEERAFTLWLSSLLTLFMTAPSPSWADSAWQGFNTRARVMSLAKEGPYLWVGMQGGLIRYDTRTQKDHVLYTAGQTEGGLISNGVYSVDVDKNGVKWIGTYGGGLVRFDDKAWHSYTPYGHGSTRHYGTQWESYRPGEGLGDMWVYDVAFDGRGRMWVATWKGASLFNGRSFRTYSVPDGLVDKWVYALAVDSDNSLWFGTEGGVTHYDGTRWASYTHGDGLGAAIEEELPRSPHAASPHHTDPSKQSALSNPNYVMSITIDAQGNKWFGTYGAGLSRFNGEKWKTYTTADGLPGNFVFALATDKKGRLWAGTNTGLGVFDGKHWKVYSRKDGLIDDFVYTILIEGNGTKWFGTRRGLSRLTGE